jgi:hypothetical protein
MKLRQLVSCTRCGFVSPSTLNTAPENGLVFNPLALGGYGEFCDPMPDYPEHTVRLCHDCTVALFRFLQVPAQPLHADPNGSPCCCEYADHLH